jgi:hypothetical protein
MLNHRHLNHVFGAALSVAAFAAFVGGAVAQTVPLIGDPLGAPGSVGVQELIVTHKSTGGSAVMAVSPVAIAPATQINSLSELAGSPANQQALRTLKSRPTQKPVHRLPNGQLTSHPSSKSLQQLGKTPGGMQLPLGDAAGPATPAPPGSNIAVTTETGFIGATTNSNLFDGASELEPPDQGLAVNNGVVFEIINNTVMIFNNTGTPLLGPIATDQYFGIGNPGS